ncbi:MAG: Ig-like domain-containing protein, partial [Candidatus Latescibacterota bacterium]
VGGTAQIDIETGEVIFTPTAQFSGTGGFTYLIEDGAGNQDEATVVVNVGAVDDVPIATNDSFTIAEDTPTELDVLENDTESDGDALTIVEIYDVTGGTASLTSDDLVLFTPVTDTVGVFGFSYVIEDVSSNRDTADVVVTVTAVTDGPLAVDDAFEILEDTPTSLPVLDNDRHPDGLAMEVIDVLDVVGGTAQIDIETGEVIFTPDFQFVGAGSFVYEIVDALGQTDFGSVTVDVLFVNDLPTVGEDVVEVGQGGAVTIDVLANDVDAEGATLTVVGVGTPGHGSASVVDGSIVYTPDPAYFGEDSFTYTADDGSGGQSEGTVVVKVIRANTLPVATDDNIVLTPEETTATFDVRSNDVDENGDVLTVVEIGAPANGSAAINSDGTIFYRRNTGFNGTDGFDYIISDGHGGTATGKVIIVAQAPAGAPIAANDVANTGEEVPVTIGVLGNDQDGGAPPLSVSGAGGTSNATVVVNGDGTITYTPNPNFGGLDSFTYTITNGAGLTASARVDVQVTGQNDPPVIETFEIVSVLENTIAVVDLSGAAFDPDNSLDQLRWEVLGVTAPIVFAEINGHILRATPGLEASGTGSVQLALIDKDGARVEGEISIFFQDVNDPPLFNETGFAPADGAVGVPRSVVLAWDVKDPDGPQLLYTVRLGRQANILNTAARNITSPNFAFAANYGETWFWQVVVTDGTTEITSGVMGLTVQADTRPPTISRIDVVDVTETG